jgi:cytochrome c551/c552
MRKSFPLFGLLAMLLVFTASCRSITQLPGQANSVKETAQAAIGQAQSFATQSAELISTAQAFATQNPAVVGTAQAFFNEQGPALLETAQAYATQHPGLLETAQALATQGINQAGSGPANIPIVPGEVQLLASTGDTLSYITPMEYRSVMEFYRVEMSAQGWAPVAQGTLETESVSVFNFTRPGQNANLTINAGDSKTIVTVTVK